MSQLVRFHLDEGQEILLQKDGGEPFRYRLKRPMLFTHFRRGDDPFSSEVGFRLSNFTLWVHLRHVRIENARPCDKCSGVGNVVVSNWRPPEKCYRCKGKGFLTTRDDAFYEAWYERKHGRPLGAADADQLPLPF
jgi:hypothetical protein